jgi:hypothetical protein
MYDVSDWAWKVVDFRETFGRKFARARVLKALLVRNLWGWEGFAATFRGFSCKVRAEKVGAKTFFQSKAIGEEEASASPNRKSNIVKIGWTSNRFRIFVRRSRQDKRGGKKTRQEIFLRNQICDLHMTWRSVRRSEREAALRWHFALTRLLQMTEFLDFSSEERRDMWFNGKYVFLHSR